MASKIKAGQAFIQLSLVDDMSKALDNAGKKLSGFGASIAKVGAGVSAAGIGIVSSIVGTALGFAKTGDEIAKMSKRTGIAVDVLSELSFVATQSGTNFESVENAVRKMQRSIYDAGRGVPTTLKAFASLGINLKELNALSPDEQFKLIGDAISKVQDPTLQAAYAMDLFGKTGTNLLPMFQLGSKGMNDLQKKAKELGLTLSTKDAKAAEDLTDALDILYRVVARVLSSIGAAVAGPLTSFAKIMSDIIVKAIVWVENNKQLVVSVLAIGSAMAALGALISSVGIGFILLGASLSGVAVVATLILPVLLGIGVALVGIISYLAGTSKGFDDFKDKIENIDLKTFKDELGSVIDKFKELKNSAFEIASGISDALSAGEIGLAARILWLGIEKEFLSGASSVLAIWDGLVQNIKKYWFNLIIDIVDGMDLIETSLSLLGKFIENIMNNAVKFWLQVWNDITKKALGPFIEGLRTIGKIMHYLGKLTDKEFSNLNKNLDTAKGGIKNWEHPMLKVMDEVAKGNKEEREKIANDFKDRQRNREGQRGVINAQNESPYADLIQKLQDRYDIAKKEFDLAKDDAARLAWYREVQKEAEAIKKAKEEEERNKKKVDPKSPVIPTPKDVSISSMGTFSAASISRTFGTITSLDVTAKNTALMVEEQRKTNELLEDQEGLAFTD